MSDEQQIAALREEIEQAGRAVRLVRDGVLVSAFGSRRSSRATAFAAAAAAITVMPY